ncbi:dipeptide ABC transporter ATP-binding protein [Natronorubrum sp. JWXQ-INN-674]|uniref:Dipeptide ABC transporter ATP-binding protein n=1 Tax=Natronorubrum halalkaliphilum TaxID=2691917 RepID=A0A6B0VIZ9_9EURY|nr:dipeptide ABC transporter ATP-binding protein [Natronorubrum halalkaliphilum]MXV61504.1 dipeptide ABC transporter ATP-binding protein [Natronorubrum halalkaliphilum]
MTDLLTVENLHTQFRTREGAIRAVDGVSFRVADGETVGIVGESGCGKSVTARSIVGLQDPGEIVAGSVHLDGVNVAEASDRQLRRLRGDTASMVFQDPTQTLNPVFDVGEQIAESLMVHEQPDSQGLLEYLHAPLFSRRSDWTDHRERAVDLMEQVGIASPEDRVDAYPHELSGGMRQRAGLAIALASDPDLLIADEPTTALDTTTQAQILERLRRLSDDRGMALLLITHDLGVVADVCDRIVVMYGGRVMETGPTERVLEEPAHPYTRALLECLTQTSERKRRVPTIEGTVPERLGEQSGCPFASRCPSAADGCWTGEIPTVELEAGTATCGEPVVFEPHERVSSHSVPAAAAAAAAADGGGGGGGAGCSADATDRSGISSARSSTASDGHAGTDPGTDADSARPSDPDSGSSLSLRPDGTPVSASTSETAAAEGAPLVSLEGVSKRFSLEDGVIDRLRGTTRHLRALDDVTLRIREGETLGLVGESGSGKSTLANLVTGLEASTAGEIRLDGESVGPTAERSADTLADVGVVFQNPHSSLNPRLTVERTIAEPLQAQGWDEQRRRARVEHLLEIVGLPERHATSYPHELSGGQVQRVAIARALALDPQLVVLDEPVSALDVSVQARILNLLLELQRDLDLTYLLISHDLDVVDHIADRVAVLYLGELMEVGPAERVLESPNHPYTDALLEAIPSLETDKRGGFALEQSVPSPIDPPSGCPFHPRCPEAEPECADTEPDWARDGAVRSKCHFARDW